MKPASSNVRKDTDTGRESDPAHHDHKDFPWFGCFKSYAAGKAHDMESIRAGIATSRYKDAQQSALK